MSTNNMVINSGVGGNNTRQLLQRLQNDVLAHHPTLVCLLAGANDLLNSGNSTPFDEYCANMRELSQRITASGSRLLLLTILPCHEPCLLTRHPAEFFSDCPPNQKIERANAFIAKHCKEKSIPLADTHLHFACMGIIGDEPESLLRNVSNSGCTDGVHPTIDGYRMLASIVFDAIQQHKLPTARVVCFGDSITRGVYMEGEGTAAGHTYPAFLSRALSHDTLAQ